MKSVTEVINGSTLFETDHLVVNTGYRSIDTQKDFLYTGKLSLLVGRPAMGKTLLATNIAARVANRGDKVCYITLEESAVMIVKKLQRINGIETDALNRIYIDDTPYGKYRVRQMMENIKNHCFDAKLIIIDSIQFLGIESIQWIYDAFPKAAVLVLNNANRKVESRESHIVELKDIDHINLIEPYFETIFSLYRDDYYNETENPNNLLNIYNLKSRLERYSYTLRVDNYSVENTVDN